jgi:hypothetical protein
MQYRWISSTGPYGSCVVQLRTTDDKRYVANFFIDFNNINGELKYFSVTKVTLGPTGVEGAPNTDPMSLTILGHVADGAQGGCKEVTNVRPQASEQDSNTSWHYGPFRQVYPVGYRDIELNVTSQNGLLKSVEVSDEHNNEDGSNHRDIVTFEVAVRDLTMQSPAVTLRDPSPYPPLGYVDVAVNAKIVQYSKSCSNDYCNVSSFKTSAINWRLPSMEVGRAMADQIRKLLRQQ